MQLAIDLQFRPEPKRQRLNPQQESILRYLKAGRSLTVGEALEQLGVYALSQRIGELKRMGWKITRQMVATESGKHIARYSLAESENS